MRPWWVVAAATWLAACACAVAHPDGGEQPLSRIAVKRATIAVDGSARAKAPPLVLGLEGQNSGWAEVEFFHPNPSSDDWIVVFSPANFSDAICEPENKRQYLPVLYAQHLSRVAYAGEIEPLTDRSQWPQVKLDFDMQYPVDKRASGRPRKNRYKGVLERGDGGPKKKKEPKQLGSLNRCKRCFHLGHRQSTCPLMDSNQEKESRGQGDIHVKIMVHHKKLRLLHLKFELMFALPISK